jgi:hypothetical protein
MEDLDPIETARRILAGDFLNKEEETVTEDLDEITIEDESDLDEAMHGKKKMEAMHGKKKMEAMHGKKKMEAMDDDDEDEDKETDEDYDVPAKSRRQLKANYGKMNATYGKMNAGMKMKKESETVVDDEKDSQDTEGKKPMVNKPVGNASSSNQATLKSKPSKASPKIETPSMQEHMDVLFNGEELSEDFKDKAITIFETAINERISAIETDLHEQYEVLIAEHTEEVTKELSEKLDDYLSYVVEQWMSENELAVETGIRADIAENFLGGLKGLFESNYIEVPEEKYDLVEQLATTVVDLEEQLQEELEFNIELKKQVSEKTADEILAEITEDLVDTDKEKLQTLAENIEFEDEDAFRAKVEILKDNYLGESVVSEEEIDESTERPDAGVMSSYTEALSRVAKNAKSNNTL